MAIRFPTTRWTLVARAADRDGPARDSALSELVARYAEPMRAYLVRARRVPTGQVEDLLQGFLASKVLANGLLAEADRGRGRFRKFLLAALSTYLKDCVRYESRARRSPPGGVVPLDGLPDPADDAADPSLIFDVEWARQVLAEALRQMEGQCVGSGRRDLWVVFEARVVGPTLGQTPAVPYPELVARHGLGSPEQAGNLLMTAKRLFRRCLRAVVRGYAADEAEVDEEIADLERILSRAG